VHQLACDRLWHAWRYEGVLASRRGEVFCALRGRTHHADSIASSCSLFSFLFFSFFFFVPDGKTKTVVKPVFSQQEVGGNFI